VEDAVSGLQSEKVARFTYPQKPFLEKTVKSWLWLHFAHFLIEQVKRL